MARTRRRSQSYGFKKMERKARTKVISVKNRQYNIVYRSKTDDELVLAINSFGDLLRKSKCTILTKKMRRKIPNLT